MAKNGHKQSKDIFIRQEQIPAFETIKKGKMKAANSYAFGKKKLKADSQKPKKTGKKK